MRSKRAYRLYLSAPMSGQPNHGYDRLNDAAYRLRRLGYAVTNPAELDESEPSEIRWGAAIIRDLQWLDSCDGICLLDGWEASPGARIEHEFAVREGKETGSLDYWMRGARR